ncbi:P-loop containing nucleoside triphosphate hydrolase protein [Podospora didyma]|uniref:P-loop containing nucleoside triphosphate hydrolase protein n=1 Tax=Podospora didyma TaxID=330526 RepID=A0AAE0K285_9PEZI|nr:P-loop containing nucleoside triphosphate hydrolase protein [Podospora didyma]
MADIAAISEGVEAVSVSSPVQALYRHDCVYASCKTRWSEFADIDQEQSKVEEKLKEQPIVHRHTYDAEKLKWVTAEFTINSPAMRELLSEALDNYQDLDLDLESWTFTPPYRPIVHRWEKLKALHKAASELTDNSARKQAADELMAFLSPLLAPWIEALAKTQETQKVTHEMVWQIFAPGELVVAKFYGIETLCRVVRYKIKKTSCYITVEYVDWDGDRCGLASRLINIEYFASTRSVSSLPVYPLAFTSNPDEMKEKMLKRGREFEKLRGYHFLSCSGTMILMNNEERPVNGRVVIDTYAYYQSNNILKPNLQSLSGETEAKPAKEKTEDIPEEEEEEDTASDTSSIIDIQDEMVSITQPVNVQRNEDLTPLSDGHCLLATPWVIGMDLKTKEWSRFKIDDLKEIEWNNKAYENLVLPEGEKELAWEFVESKGAETEVYDDFVAEKGRGIIILMFGPPGVGKTFTAEAVAERARVPLYSMSAGVLGTQPYEVEAALTHALDLCRMWKAMLLLDEADVFLGARTDEGLARNELVSIFLTKLEYYQGILFLTTNRFASIDHAFQSRVDLFLPYRALTSSARRQVWDNFFNHHGRARFSVDEEELDKLSELKLNGREIKNLIKSAQLLSIKANGKVTYDRLYSLAEKRVAALKLLAEQGDDELE